MHVDFCIDTRAYTQRRRGKEGGGVDEETDRQTDRDREKGIEREGARDRQTDRDRETTYRVFLKLILRDQRTVSDPECR